MKIYARQFYLASLGHKLTLFDPSVPHSLAATGAGSISIFLRTFVYFMLNCLLLNQTGHVPHLINRNFFFLTHPFGMRY
ncbi:MAG: hypothetical protein KAS23_00250 [Anaerohalosphaera sp.]|nr:hypothetical protein [Anaerohalosphaera sp.]